MTTPGSVAWLARHELRLSLRDLVSLLTAGRRRRAIGITIGLIVFAVVMHFVASFVVGKFAGLDPGAGKGTLVYVTAIGFLAWSLMVSQALEAVTRAFYQRADLDLILSSPVDPRLVFIVRIGAVAISVTVMAMLLAGAFIDMLAVNGGVRWLAAYGVVAAGGLGATAVAVVLTVGLFKTIGPKRTRFVAQIIAAVIGASFVIGLQGAAVLSYGTISRFAILQSQRLAAHLPDLNSFAWTPARAILGDPGAMVAVVAGALLLLAGTALLAGQFGDQALAAAGVGLARARRGRAKSRFRPRPALGALRRKEWVLLYRDPWLMSQTLMQLLYLLPPALLLWQNFGDNGDAELVLVPILVVAAGQLAGGLAWLAISGEDAPDLIATAPITPRTEIRAKVEAVLIGIAIIALPLVAAMWMTSPWAGLVTAVFSLLAALGATAVQLIFRGQAKRSQFRRRQTSSRFATFAEAFSSMAWAGAAGLAASGSWLAGGAVAVAIGVLGIAWLIRPRAQVAAKPVSAQRQMA